MFMFRLGLGLGQGLGLWLGLGLCVALCRLVLSCHICLALRGLACVVLRCGVVSCPAFVVLRCFGFVFLSLPCMHSKLSSEDMVRTSTGQSKVRDIIFMSCICLFAAACLRFFPVIVLHCFVSCLFLSSCLALSCLFVVS
jgi:hypothetical protein